jgi:hypothetical protein
MTLTFRSGAFFAYKIQNPAVPTAGSVYKEERKNEKRRKMKNVPI